MQNQERIEELMDEIKAIVPARMCKLCIDLYAEIPGAIRVCWFNEAANSANFNISLYELTNPSGRKNVENCVNQDIVKKVLEIQTLAADSGSVDLED